MSHPQALSASASMHRQTSRVSLESALKASDCKDLSLWASLVRFDVIAAAASSTASPSTWRAIASQAEAAIAGHREAWKASPTLYLSVTLDQTRALLRSGSVGEAKKTLGTLRSVAAAKHSWEFFKLLIIIECQQGAWGPIALASGAHTRGPRIPT